MNNTITPWTASEDAVLDADNNVICIAIDGTDAALFNSTEDYAIWCEDQPRNSEAWLLRQKADAIERAIDACPFWHDRTYLRVDEIKEYAKFQRLAADEADKAGGGNE